jgi:hypothetical protein
MVERDRAEQRAKREAEEAAKTPAQRKREAERAKRDSDRYWERARREQERREAKVDQDALRLGRRAAEDISLDAQIREERARALGVA